MPLFTIFFFCLFACFFALKTLLFKCFWCPKIFEKLILVLKTIVEEKYLKQIVLNSFWQLSKVTMTQLFGICGCHKKVSFFYTLQNYKQIQKNEKKMFKRQKVTFLVICQKKTNRLYSWKNVSASLPNAIACDLWWSHVQWAWICRHSYRRTPVTGQTFLPIRV